ncbi:MAG: T9SS type A sorting domain-containing protein [Ignavibacteria bacterium]|nr:T9SS type A sorting domain-containing protein [Ignavibacteria bacterium]
MKNIVFAAILFFLILSSNLHSQDKNKVHPVSNVKYSYLTPDGKPTDIKPEAPKFTPEKEKLLKQLMKERLAENTPKAREIQKRLDQIDGSFPMNLSNDPVLTGVIDSTGGPQIPQQLSGENDFNNSVIASGNIWAIATQTSSKSTALFAAVTEDVFGSGDICKVYVSYDGGRNWILKYTYNGFASNVNIRANELDVEPIINGADTIVYVGFGYDLNNQSRAYFMRVNIVNGTSTNGAWNYWGSLHPCNCVNIYNPKITSDNSRYGADTYVYFTVSKDSVELNTWRATQQMAVNTAPFSGNTFTNRYQGACGGFNCIITSTQSYLYQDICFYNNGIDDRIYLACNNDIFQYVFCFWSNDYGVKAAGFLGITEDQQIDQLQLQSCGGTSNQNIAIAYRKRYNNGTDWDFRGQFSISGGTTLNSFTSSWIDYTTNRTRFVSMQSIGLSQGRYVFSWADSSNGLNGTHKFSQTNDAGNSFTAPVVSSPVGTGALSLGGTHAGYRASGSADSSITLWSQAPGTSAFCSYNILSTIGIQPTGNEVADKYSLSQNYPNPFNPSTDIRFSIAKQTVVKITIFDMTGKEIEQLYNGELSAGNYKAEWDAAGHSSGVYFYRLETDNFTDTKKMVLVK